MRIINPSNIFSTLFLSLESLEFPLLVRVKFHLQLLVETLENFGAMSA